MKQHTLSTKKKKKNKIPSQTYPNSKQNLPLSLSLFSLEKELRFSIFSPPPTKIKSHECAVTIKLHALHTLSKIFPRATRKEREWGMDPPRLS